MAIPTPNLAARTDCSGAPSLRDECADEFAAATYLEKRPRTLQRWRHMRTGPRYIRIGKKPYYPWSWLHEWALSQTEGGR
jgi:hypothetical protein